MTRVLFIVMCLLSDLLPAAPSQGVARTVGEAPGGAPLAATAPATPNRAEDPAAARSMAFDAAGSECRETVPGGTLLVIAYAVVLLVLGGYVALLARKNAQLEASLAALEDEIRKRAKAV